LVQLSRASSSSDNAPRTDIISALSVHLAISPRSTQRQNATCSVATRANTTMVMYSFSLTISGRAQTDNASVHNCCTVQLKFVDHDGFADCTCTVQAHPVCPYTSRHAPMPSLSIASCGLLCHGAVLHIQL